MSISGPKPHSAPSSARRRLEVHTRVAGADSAAGAGPPAASRARRRRRRAGPRPARTGPCRRDLRCRSRGSGGRRPPVGLGDLGGEGDDAFETGLDFTGHGDAPFNTRSGGLRSLSRIGASRRPPAPVDRLPFTLRRRARRAAARGGGVAARGRGRDAAPDRGTGPGAGGVHGRRRRPRDRAGARHHARRPAGVRRRPDRDQGQHARRRPGHGLRHAPARRPPHRPTTRTSCGGCATRGS